MTRKTSLEVVTVNALMTVVRASISCAKSGCEGLINTKLMLEICFVGVHESYTSV